MTSDITAYLAGTPNGYKVSITLEELGLPYKVHAIKLMEGEQKSDWFLKINPNGRMPALTDGAYTLFESIACMQYLVDKYDTEHKLSFPHGSVEYYESLSWLAFHTGGIGPNLGSAFYYQTMANARCDYAIGRFMNETRRLFSILDKRLATRQWLVGDKYSIVDIAHCSWVRGHYMVKIDLDEYPNLKAWCSKIETREAVKRGIEAIPGRSREESEKRFDEMRAKVYAMENTDKR